MAIISSNIKLPTTGGKKTTTGGTTVKLPTTGGTYTSYLGTGGGKSTNPTTPIAVGQTTPLPSVGGSGASNGGTYTNYLSTVVTPPSGTVNGYTEVKPVNNTQYFDGGAVGTTDGGFSGDNNNGITDEGLIVGATKNADDATFDNNGFKGNGELFYNPSSGTGSEVIKTSASVGGNDKKEEEKVETGGDTSGGDTGDTGSTGEIPMTYQEYYAEAMKQAEADKAAAVKRAEVAEERAMADAQASYMQNMATYGANAEQLAQMGLTGGGYSDYLNAQAYAQKREDAQVATANKNSAIEAAESTYADNVLGLKKEMADITYAEGLKKDEEAKEAAEELTSNYSGILIEVQANPDAFNETGLRAWCKNNGFDETQTQSVVDTWKEATALADAALDVDGEEKTPVVMSDVIKDIQAGAYVKQNADGSTTPYTWDEIKAMLLQARNNGENVTDEDIENAKKAYDEWIAYRDGKVSTDEYYDSLNGDEDSQEILNNAVDPTKYETEAKSKAESYGVRKEYTGKVINTNRDTYKASEFGDFNDIGDAGSKQGKYVQAIVNDAKAGKIKEGQIVHINYGAIASDHGYYMYVGDGCFVRIGDDGYIQMIDDGYFSSSKAAHKSIYLPDGYKWNLFDNVKEK